MKQTESPAGGRFNRFAAYHARVAADSLKAATIHAAAAAEFAEDPLAIKDLAEAKVLLQHVAEKLTSARTHLGGE